MPSNHYDLIVIGTGPAGEGAAMKASKAGKTVASIEEYSKIGGGATHWGTIPSKALRAAIQHINLVHQKSTALRELNAHPTFNFPHLLDHARHIVELQADLRTSFYHRNNIDLHFGHGRFLDPHRIQVVRSDGASEEFTADAFVIGTGSRPYRPSDIDFAHSRILDSDKLLTLPITPKSCIIYGAGVVGCEYASMLNNMGIAVTLINTRSKLLAFLDDEIADALSFHLSDCGVRILHNEEYESVLAHGNVEDSSGHVEARLKSGKLIKADVFLFANGRSGNSDALGLEALNVKANSRGQIEVNDNLQVKITGTDAPAPSARPEHLTGQAAIVGATRRIVHSTTAEGEKYYDHIFAAGDIIGVPALASASYDQGRFAATLVVSGEADYHLVNEIPTGIYTTPEISSLGRTEAQLTAEKIPYVAGKSLFRTLARAQITGHTTGMLKLLFHRETLELLGIHCFGENASEIIHIGQAIMSQQAPANSLNYFLHTTFNYPTMAEAYRVAALNGLDQL